MSEKSPNPIGIVRPLVGLGLLYAAIYGADQAAASNKAKNTASQPGGATQVTETPEAPESDTNNLEPNALNPSTYTPGEIITSREYSQELDGYVTQNSEGEPLIYQELIDGDTRLLDSVDISVGGRSVSFRLLTPDNVANYEYNIDGTSFSLDPEARTIERISQGVQYWWEEAYKREYGNNVNLEAAFAEDRLVTLNWTRVPSASVLARDRGLDVNAATEPFLIQYQIKPSQGTSVIVLPYPTNRNLYTRVITRFMWEGNTTGYPMGFAGSRDGGLVFAMQAGISERFASQGTTTELVSRFSDALSLVGNSPDFRRAFSLDRFLQAGPDSIERQLSVNFGLGNLDWDDPNFYPVNPDGSTNLEADYWRLFPFVALQRTEN